MVNSLTPRETALHYYVDDLPSAIVPGTRLQNILDCLHSGKPVTPISVSFLEQQALDALHRLATGSLHYDGFRTLALAERTIRIEAATAASLVHEAAKRASEVSMQTRMASAREQFEKDRVARESDPAYIAKFKNQQLRARYGIDTYVEQHCIKRLMNILKIVDADQRLSQDDFIWLSTVGESYFSDLLQTAYHRLEANFFSSEFKRTRDPWMAVNASGHYRKSNQAHDADSLLNAINVELQKSPKLKAALCTTHGGVKRDLQHWDEAIGLGEKAHALKSDDYRPCTLLGAIYMETGNYNLGQIWYAKAVERGATVDSVDRDLRNIFFQADLAKQAQMRKFLLSENPVRYAWAASSSSSPKRRPRS